VSKVLIVVSSSREHDGAPTGFFFSELTHPHYALTRAGHEVDIASPAGGEPLITPYSDPREERSLEHGDLIGLGFLASDTTMDRLRGSLRLADVDLARYDAVLFAGGTGPLHDFAANPDVSAAVGAAWAAGGIVSAVCHGALALVGGRTPEGAEVVDGRDVTGYSKAEDKAIESFLGPGRSLPCYVEDELRAAGGRYRDGGPGARFVVTSADGRLITGQNQQSALELGLTLASALTARGGRP
jgi:putative intracellular protease/amidase